MKAPFGALRLSVVVKFFFFGEGLEARCFKKT